VALAEAPPDKDVAPDPLTEAVWREKVAAAQSERRQRKEAEEQLVLQTSALESAANGIMITDRAGQILKDIVAEMRREPEYRQAIRGDLELWGVDKVDGSMASIVGQIRCTDSGRWPVQREFNRRMKRRFQKGGIEIASAGQTILMQIPAPADVASDSMLRRAAG